MKSQCCLCGLLIGLTAVLASGNEWEIQGSPKTATVSKESDGAVRFRFISRPGRNDSSSIIQKFHNLPSGKTWIFSAQGRAEGDSRGFLQVTFRKNGKGTGWEESSQAVTKEFRPLSIEFDNDRGADEIELKALASGGGIVEFLRLEIQEKSPDPPGLRVTSTLECGSVYLSGVQAGNSGEFQMQLRFREKHGQSWQNGPDLVLVPDEQQARTSLFNLRPDTEYEIEVFGNDAGTERRFQQEFRTWSASPPIAKTVTLDAESFNGQLVISQSGKPDGWVKYTATPGTVLQGNQQADAVIQVRGANYIVLENLTIRGGEHYGIELVSTDQVRVVNCDIAGFGQKGEQRRDLDGKFYINAKAVNYDAGIFINGSSNLLIERCYIHDPKGTANPWFFSHPAGPTAIFVKAAGGTVIRYNDLIGSDSHRWNDVIEGFNNSSKNGGFRCDADVYGNFMAFGNDDGIEFDGGQMNCRFFENRVEGTLCGISLAPCLRGPSYILKNQFINPGDVAGARLYVIKNSKNLLPKGRLHVYSNTAAGKWGYGFSRYGGNGPAAGYEKELKGIVLNNLFGGDFGMSSDTRAAKHRFDYNLYTKNYPWGEAPMEGTNSIFSSPQWINSSRGDYRLAPSSPGTNKALTITGLNLPKDIGSGDNMPRRPTPFALDASELHFSKDSGAIHTVTVQGEGTFRIAQNEATTFFTVLPSSGKAPLKLQVKLGPDVENSGKRFLGAFAVRGEDGWSRTVSVYADFLDFLKTKPGILIDRFRGREQFEAVPGPVPGRKAIRFEGNNRTLNAEFEVPEAGAYYIFARVCGNGSVMLSLDDEPLRRCSFYTGSERWGYSGVAYIEGGGFYSGRPFRPLQLTRGKHSLRLIPHSNAVDFDAFYIVPVDNLDDFLPIFTEGR